MKQEELIGLAVAVLPYPEQITNINLTSEKEAIRFDWRGTTYRISKNGLVEEVGDGVLIGSDKCILMRRLFKNQHFLQG